MNKADQNRPSHNQDKIGDTEISMKNDMSLNNMTQKKKRNPIMLTLFSFFIYVIFFALIYQFYGQAMAISATIPVIVVGWFYGLMPGICAGILSYPVNILMYFLFGAEGVEGMVVGGGGISGTFALILIGAIIGRIRDLSSQLKNHRDRLDELVQLQTDELQKSNKKLTLEINEKVEAFKKLEEAKANLDNIIDNSSDCIMVSDKVGYIEKFNKYFLELLDYQEEEVAGKFIAELTPVNVGQTYTSVTGELLTIDEAYLNRSQEMINRLLEKGKVSNWEAYYLLRDGRVIPVEQNIVCLYDHEGERTGAVAIIRDITERKNSESELRKTKESLDNLIESSLDGITVSDNLGHVTRVNKAFLKLIGFDEEEVIGKHIMELSVLSEGTYESTTGELIEINEEFFNTSMEMTVKLFEEGKISHWESYYLRKDGKIVPVEMKIAHLYNAEGDNTGAVGISRDITERRKIEQVITEARDFLEDIFKTTADGIIVTDNEGSITMLNEATLSMLGYSQDELIGKSTSLLNPQGEDYEELTNQYLSILFEESTVSAFELTYLKKDGTLIDVEVNSALLKDDKDNITGSVASIRDITERKKAEEEIKEAKGFLESVIESSNDGILTVDEKGNILTCNTAMEKISGFNKKELVGIHASSIVVEDKEIRKYLREKAAELYEKGFATYEATYAAKDGKSVVVDCTSSMIKNEKGDNIAGVSVLRDITERKKVEREIKETRDFLKSVIEGSRDGIVIVDGQGYITSANTAIEKMCKFSKEELIGKHASELTIDDNDIRKKILKKTEELYERGYVFCESKQATKDDNIIDVEYSLSMIKNDKSDYIAGVAIIRDITERKNMEQKLLQSEKLKSLGELAGGVAHDFNNVLAAILGRAQLLKMQFKPPPGVQEKRKSMLDLIKSLEIIERASSDGAETVRRIQEFSRKRSDDKDFTQVNINELLDNVLEFTAVRWKNDAESKGIKINIQKEFLPLPSTLGSAAELREVFTNIINNALDAMPQGGSITIKTSTENNHISIRIKDTGVGIPEDIRNRIFDPFFTTKGVQSTGLGMSTSYGIINRHKGTISVASPESTGTTFTINIPISENTLEAEEKTKPILKEKRKATILVIEDEEEVRNLLADILIEGGHNVETTSDGNQGIEMFKDMDFDMVFTDLGMPGVSGWEVAETVKNINRKIPVAIITGWNVEMEESEMRERGVNLIAHKPFEVNQILSLVQEGMELREQFEAA